MSDIAGDFSILWPALVAGFLVVLSHVPLGQQVLRRGIVFVAIAVNAGRRSAPDGDDEVFAVGVGGHDEAFVGGVDDLAHADARQIAVSLVGEDDQVGPHPLDAGRHGRPQPG